MLAAKLRAEYGLDQSLWQQFSSYVSGLAVGDYNEDGLPDIAAGNSGANNISILLHR